MSAPKRTKEQRESDLNTLAVLYVKKVPQSEMAKRLGVSQGQISNDIKKLLVRWENNQINQIDKYKNEQLTRINEIEREMWESWEKSKTLPMKKITSRTRGGKYKELAASALFAASEDDKEASNDYWKTGIIEEIASGGDMQYMNGIMWCVQERSKIIGLNAPKKIAQTNPEGTAEAGKSVRDELMSMIAGVARKMNPTEEAVEGEIIEEDEIDPAIRDRVRESIRSLPAYSENAE